MNEALRCLIAIVVLLCIWYIFAITYEEITGHTGWRLGRRTGAR